MYLFLKGEHTRPKNTPIGFKTVGTPPGPVRQFHSVEYGEVTKEGGGYGRYTQIYANGSVVCIVTSRNRNNEVTVCPDYHVENWKDGKFESMGGETMGYGTHEGQERLEGMWRHDFNWTEKAIEFYLEVDETRSTEIKAWPIPRLPWHKAQAHLLLMRVCVESW